MTPAVRLLEQRGVAHRVRSYEHSPDADSYGAEAADALGVDPATVFKTLVADVAPLGLVVAVVPVLRRLDLRALANVVGAKRATMADPVVAERSSGYVVGGISPLGQRKVLPTVIDASAQNLAEMHVSGGKRGLEIALSPADLAILLRAAFHAIAA